MLKTLTYLITFAFIGCSDSNRSCHKFHIGKFIGQSDFDGAYTIVERSDSLQVERNKTSGHISIARISWINDCEYELMFIEQGGDTAKENQIPPYIQNHKLVTRILSTSRDYYIFESSMEGVDRKLVDTLFILK